MVYIGDPRELVKLLKYHIGEEFIVSGGVTSHTRVKPMSGERLELGLVRMQNNHVKLIKRTQKCIFASFSVTWSKCVNACFGDHQLIHSLGQGVFKAMSFFLSFFVEELHYVRQQGAGC